MSFAARLIHRLAIVSPTVEATFDEYNHSVPGDPVVVEVAGLVQPKSVREMPLVDQGGAMVADHTIFLLPQPLSSGAYIRFVPDDGDRYEIRGIRSFEFGRSPHLEVDARRVATGIPETVAS